MLNFYNYITRLLCKVNKIEKIIKYLNLCHKLLEHVHHHNVGINYTFKLDLIIKSLIHIHLLVKKE